MNVTMIAIAVFVGVFGLIAAVGVLIREFSPSAAEDRLSVLTGQKSQVRATSGVMKKEVLQEGMTGLQTIFSRATSGTGNLRKFFVQANSPITIDTFFLLSLGAAGMGVVIAILINAPMALYPVIGLVMGLFPLTWLWLRRGSRMKKFGKQMPDAMELIARALRSGHSLASGLHVVVEEMPDPIATEFANAYEQQNLGIPIEKALKSMMDRMPNMDLKFFVTAVSIQKQAGGDLAEILDKIGYVVRERFKIMGQVQALTGEGRISGVVLMGLPILLFFAVYYLNPEYIMVLFTHPTGKKMIGIAFFLQILGAFAIKRIVNIKV